MRAYLLGGLVFDGDSHSLTAARDILLYQVLLTPLSGPQTVNFTYGATVGVSVAEPNVVANLAIAAVVFWLGRRRQTRERTA